MSTERIVELGRYRVRVHSYAHRSRPDAPPVVFLPGMAASGHAVGPQIRAVRRIGYTPHVIDLPGFGLAPAMRKEDGSFAQLADLVRATCETVGIERAVFIGHSLGGGIALHLALRSPEMVERLVLLAPASVGPSLVWLYRLFCLPLVGRALLGPPAGGGRGRAAYLRYFLLGDRRKDDERFVHAVLAEDAPSVWANVSMRNIVWANQPSRRDRPVRFIVPGNEQRSFMVGPQLARIAHIPTLVLWGAQDRVLSVRDADFFRQHHPGAQVHVTPGVGHMLTVEDSVWVNEHIEKFLGAPSAPSTASAPAPSARPSIDVQGRELTAEERARRPWVSRYDPGVPHALVYPEATIDDMLRQSASRYARAVCTSFLGRTVSYSEMDMLVSRFASALQGLGLQRGDRVALVLPNCPQFVIAHFGTLRAGGTVVPCNPTYTAEEIERQLADSGATAVVTLTKMYPAVAEAIRRGRTSVRHVIATSIKDFMPAKMALLFSVAKERQEGHLPELAPGVLDFARLLRSASPWPRPAAITPDDVAVLQYTGGTTGIPKAAMLTHRALVANALQCLAWDTGMRPGKDGVLALMPFFHVYGLTVVLHTSVLSGARMALIPKFDLKQLLETIARERPRLFPGAPRIYIAINEARGLDRYDLTSIEACLSGSAPLPEDVARRFEAISGGRVVEGYGLTEAAPVTHANPLKGDRRIGSVGLPVPDIDCKVVDIDTGETELGPGAVGELCVRGPNLMAGYYRRDDETDLVLRDGWLHTGDIGRMTEDGYFEIVDRKKEMIIVNGLKVFPREVDEVLYAHPAVLHAAAIGVPDRTHGEVVKAFVVLRPAATATPEELRAHCAERMAKYKVPGRIEIRSELPMTILGKVLRRVLAEEERARAQAA